MGLKFLFCFIALFLPTTSLLATSFWDAASWRAVFGVEAGVAITSDGGESKTFPINTGSAEFYKYSPHHPTQTEAIYGGFAGAEWQGSPQWNIQFDANYNQSSSFLVKGVLAQGVDVQSQDFYEYKYKIIIRQLLVETQLSYVKHQRLRPYVQVGIGPSFNRAYSYSTTVPSSLTFTRTYTNNTATGFTYAVGAGLDVEIVKWLRMGVSYHFTDFGKASLGSASIDGIAVSGTLSQDYFYANEVLAQLTFVF